MTDGAGRSPLGGRGRLFAIVVVGGPVATATAVLSQWSILRDDPAFGLINVVVAVAFVMTGLIYADRPSRRTTGWAFGLTGVLWLVNWWNEWGIGPLPLLSATVGPLAYASGVWAVLLYPDPALLLRRERVFVLVVAGWMCGGQVVVALLSRPRWLAYAPDVWWPDLASDRSVFDTATTVYSAGGVVLAIAAMVTLLARVRRMRALDRAEVTPFTVATCSAAAMGGAVMIGTLFHLPDPAEDTVFAVEALALLAIPFAFLTVVVRQRLSRLTVAGLLLGFTGPVTAASVRSSLRAALGDPDLDVLAWAPSVVAYVDADGQPAPLPASSEHREVVEVTASDGSPLAAVTVHPSLRRRRRLVESAVAACRMALENTRLQATAQAQLEQVSASRTRIVETAIATRRTFERDLHDGAQQRLLSVALVLGAARSKISDPAVLALLDGGRDELRDALTELRGLARGVHPPVLGQSGLGPALESVAEQLPLNVDMVVPAQRFSAAVESTAYYVASEALTNVARHAGTTRASLRIEATGDVVVVAVTDRGVGGADAGRGRRMADIVDRVGALGGRVTVESAPGAGTRLTAHIPTSGRRSPDRVG